MVQNSYLERHRVPATSWRYTLTLTRFRKGFRNLNLFDPLGLMHQMYVMMKINILLQAILFITLIGATQLYDLIVRSLGVKP